MVIALWVIISALLVSPAFCPPTVGFSDNGILVEEWRYDMQSLYTTLLFGSSSAIADLGVNDVGGEPDCDLEIIIGSDEYANYYPELGGAYAQGIWRVLDSQGNLEWAKDTGTDESRSSPNVADINADGYLEIVGGTTSGWNVEAMDRYGNFLWTFPWPPQQGGPFVWHSSPAVADVDPSISGLEVFIGNNAYNSVWALDGDNTDGVDDGITATDAWIYGGTEGIDWDVLWKFETDYVYSSPALGDVDNDGDIEVVIGDGGGNVYVLDGKTGVLEWSYSTGGAVHASAAIANLDGDPYLEIVIGSGDGNIYCLEWNGTTGSVEWTYSTGSPVYSSAAIGDIDGDSALEIVDASTNGDIYALSASGSMEWTYSTGSSTVSSPALADRSSVMSYDRDWPMFRHDPMRTGLYGPSPCSQGLDVYIGADDGYLYLIEGGGGGGAGGTLIDRFLTYGRLYTSPSVADIDGDSRSEIVFYDAEPGHDGHYTYWCVEDLACTPPTPVIPEVPLGTIMASAAMIIALVGYFAIPKFGKKQTWANP